MEVRKNQQALMEQVQRQPISRSSTWVAPFVFVMVALRENSREVRFPRTRFHTTLQLVVHVTSACYFLTAFDILRNQKVQDVPPFLGTELFWITWLIAFFQVSMALPNRKEKAQAIVVPILRTILLVAIAIFHLFEKTAQYEIIAMIALLFEPFWSRP